MCIRDSLNTAGHLETVDPSDVRVIEGGEHLGFTLESCKPIRIVRHALGKGFDGNVAMQLRVMGAIHFAHSAFAELVEDPIWTNGLVNHESSRRDYTVNQLAAQAKLPPSPDARADRG